MIVREPIRADIRWQEECIRYSICTIINRRADYAEMVESFRAGGFREPECEFLYLDNSEGNAFDAYTGNNLFLSVARGEFIILCHQDILLIEDGRENLDTTLVNLTLLDPNWAVCGNAGGNQPGQCAIRITDPHGADQRTGKFPVKVRSLDENFIVVRRSANVALSRDVGGFHLFGTDLCIVADILGGSCYVIDFHLRHKSGGVAGDSFFKVRERVILKYRLALRSRWIATTCTTLFLSGVPFLGQLLSSEIAVRITRCLFSMAAWLSRTMERRSDCAVRR